MMKKAYVYFHQGWGDIAAQLSLIDYYKSFYELVRVVMRYDSKNLVDYYIREKEGIEINYIQTDCGRHLNHDYMNDIDDSWDLRFHGGHDMWRKDQYRYASAGHNPKGYDFHIEVFYGCYDIDQNVRVDYFNLNRDLDLEKKTYDKFVEIYGKEYVIIHDDSFISGDGQRPPVDTTLKFDNKLDIPYVNLSKISDTFFDYIEVIRNAKEIHVIDSIWGILIYQLDAKYGLFSDKIIRADCCRGWTRYFNAPKKLDNWIITSRFDYFPQW